MLSNYEFLRKKMVTILIFIAEYTVIDYIPFLNNDAICHFQKKICDFI